VSSGFRLKTPRGGVRVSHSEVDVTIVIPTRNRAAFLERMLAQLAQQRSPDFTFDVVVADDGSMPSMETVVRRADRGSARRIEWLRLKGRGVSRARNTAARYAQGRYLHFVDDDMTFGANHLREHLQTHGQFDPVAVSSLYETRTAITPPPFRTWYEARTDAWELMRARELMPFADGLYEAGGQLLSPGSFSIERALFAAVGGFDESYQTSGCEGMDLGLRLNARGVRLLRLARGQVLHVEPRTTLRKLCERQRVGAAATVHVVQRFAAICGETPLARVNGPLRLGDTAASMARKLGKSVLYLQPFRGLLFALIAGCESWLPASRLLPRAYDIAVGVHIQSGWRWGLRQYRGGA
jgi:GT2 family glycosyltransferase